jgi:hypothetical protein
MRRDGIPISTLDASMTVYMNIFQMDILAKFLKIAGHEPAGVDELKYFFSAEWTGHGRT